MENQFKSLSDYDINLLVAKEELKYQPFVRFYPQLNIFGGEFSEEDDICLADDFVHIVTESGKPQKISFCALSSDWQNLMFKEKISVNFSECGGGSCSTDTSFFVDFVNEYSIPRAVAITYLISKSILEPEGGKNV